MKIDKLLKIAKQETMSKREAEILDIFGRMTTEQLKELAFDDLPEDRVKEIFESVGGLHLLGGENVYGKA